MARCHGCHREESVNLVDGKRVCNYCPEWRLECEARQLLRYPLQKRRELLDARLKPRGKKGVEELKEVMAKVFARQRK